MLQLKSILAPTDFSKHSEAALQYAIAFADEFGCSVHLFHALGHPTQYGFGGVNAEEVFEGLTQDAKLKMEEFHDAWAAYNFPVNREIRTGSPFVEIIRYAREKSIDLIVMERTAELAQNTCWLEVLPNVSCKRHRARS